MQHGPARRAAESARDAQGTVPLGDSRPPFQQLKVLTEALHERHSRSSMGL